jgi:predicted DNA binding protein
LPSSFVIAAYIKVRLIPQDCLPDRQVKGIAGALHLGIFDQPKTTFLKRILEEDAGIYL